MLKRSVLFGFGLATISLALVSFVWNIKHSGFGTFFSWIYEDLGFNFIFFPVLPPLSITWRRYLLVRPSSLFLTDEACSIDTVVCPAPAAVSY